MAARSSPSGAVLKAGLALAVAAGAIFWFTAGSRTPVQTHAVSVGTVANVISGSLTVRAEKEQPVESDINGLLAVSHLDPGKRVEKDDVLAELDQTAIKLDITKIEIDQRAAVERQKLVMAEDSSDRLALKSNESTLTFYQGESKRGNMDPTKLAEQAVKVQGLREKIKQDEILLNQTVDALANQLKLRQRDLANTTIKANFAGEIAEVFAHPGAQITARTPLATLISLDRIYEATISQEKFTQVELGQAAKVRFSGSSTIYDATIDRILPTANPVTQLYTVYLKIPQVRPETVRPGLRGDVDILVGEHSNVVRVPRRAILFGEVFVVTGGRVEKRPVTVGYQDLEFAEVVKGLAKDELVVVDRVGALRDGQRVTVAEAAK